MHGSGEERTTLNTMPESRGVAIMNAPIKSTCQGHVGSNVACSNTSLSRRPISAEVAIFSHRRKHTPFSQRCEFYNECGSEGLVAAEEVRVIPLIYV